MTREEAIAKIGEQYKICQEFYNLSANPQKDYPDVTAYMEALDTALSALRPISREQVEKVFPGCQSCKSCRSCVFSIHQMRDQPCKKCDPNAECALTEYKPSNFCPICGKPLTNEAVQMVMQKLEALKDGKDD